MFIVGIDIGKNTHEATITNQKGEKQGKSFRFPNSHQGFLDILERIKKTVGNDSFECGMEATGHYWLSLYTHLKAKGITVHVFNSIQTAAMRDMFIRQTKTDSRDSFLIAEVIRFGRYCDTQIDSSDLHGLRELCRNRFAMVDMVSDIKRKVIALLDQVFPEYEKIFSDTFGKTSLEILSEFTTPEEILSLDTDKLAEIISTASRGKLGLQKAQQLQESARNSFGVILDHSPLAMLIRIYIDHIKFAEGQIAQLDAEISNRFSAFDNTLTSITGVGDVLAAVILSEIGDINRFSSPDKLAAFAGISPRVKQSGDHSSSGLPISKRGSPYLRRAIWLAAVVASFKDPAIHHFYQRKRSQGKSHLSALGHVSRKLVNIIFVVLRDNISYKPLDLSS